MDINSIIKICLKGFKQIINNCIKSIQDMKLARYVIKRLAEKDDIYRKDYFDNPTIENTSVLRDYVHHRLTKDHLNLKKAVYVNGKTSMLQVLQWLEEKTFRVQCGGLAQILFGIYRGLGYSAVLCDWVDKDPSNYTDSHILVEVYIPQLNKYIIQDPSFNIMVTYCNKPIGTLELMRLLQDQKIVENREIVFMNNQDGDEGIFTPVKDLDYENYIAKYLGQMFSWSSGLNENYPASNLMYPAVKTHRSQNTGMFSEN